VVRTDDGFDLRFRPRSDIEEQSAALSLATNMAVADALHAAGTGLFRTMDGVDDAHTGRLRNTAKAFGLEWARQQPLAEFLRTLPADHPSTGAFQLAVRRAGGAARYQPYTEGVIPWHAAVAATYSHATAPLRRLADRYVIEAAVRVSVGAPVPEWITSAFARVPEVMERADSLANRVDRAALDVAEAIVLTGREGELFDAVVTDEDQRGVRFQIREPAIVSRTTAHGVDPGDPIRVRLTKADPAARVVEFQRVS
jgi:exoribonuclease R